MSMLSSKDIRRDLDEFQQNDFSSDYRLRALFSSIPIGGRLLDIGSGNGYIADLLKGKFNKIVLSDYSMRLVNMLRYKFSSRYDVEVLWQDATSLSADEKFDVITACDILEHIKDDLECLRNCKKVLAEDGVLFISVPAFQFLYGARDKKYGHIRRYSKKSLRSKLLICGLTVERIYYWNAIAFIPYFISEKILRKPLVGPARTGKMSGTTKIINKMLYLALRLELYMPLPFGLTLIAICRKKNI